jgi:cytochrome c biogenesis protein
MNSKQDSNIIIRFFSSIKLTIFLLIILAAVSIIGTVIPQQEGALKYAMRLDPQVFQVFKTLNLFDLYHSLWFRLILGCLLLNLVICSIDRFPATWKRFSHIPKADRDKPFEDISNQQTLVLSSDLTRVSDRVEQFMRSHYKNIIQKERDTLCSFFVQKGRFSHFGVYLVHLSVILILLGALAGSFFGFEAYVNIVEGDKTSTVNRRGEKQKIDLGFDVRCDKFTVDFYKNGQPREYKSELTFLVNGEVKKKGSLLVNHPLQFMGITFYQSRYGTIPGNKVALEILQHEDKNNPVKLEIKPEESIQLPGNDGSFRLVDLNEDLVGIGPAVLISVQPTQGQEKRFWIFKNTNMAKKRLPQPMLRSQKFNPSAFSPYTFILENLESSYYTGLQVNKDPGVLIVWLGFFMMMSGLFITFFTSHRKIWVRVESHKQKVKLSVAGTANKNPVGLQRELERLTRNFAKQFNQ